MGTEGTLRVKVVGDVADFQSKMNGLQGTFTKATAVMGLSGAAIGSGLASSVQAFSKFDDQMRGVYSILPGISKTAMTAMEGQVKSLAVEMGRLPEDIIPGLYDALSSGIPQDNVFAFMESAAKAAAAGGANTQEVVKVLSATINAFGLDAADTEKLTDSFFNAINKGVTTFPELAAAMSQVTPTAAAMGLSIEDVLAAITAMTLQGTPTAQAVTGINASLIALQRTTPAMETALKNLGFATGQAGLEALGYQGLMEALAGEAKKAGVPLIELTGRMEGSAAMLQLTGEKAGKANELLASFGDTAGLTTAAFETMEGGVGGAARRLAAQIRVTMIDIGEQFQALGPLFTAFGPTMGRLLGAGIGAAAGLITSGFVALMTRLIPSLIPAAALTGTATGTAQGEAHSVAATGPQVIKALFTRIAAMAIPLAPAGTTIGTAVGGAMGVGMIAGLFAAAAAAPALPLILNKLTGEDAESKFATAGVRAAQMYASGFSDEIQAGYAAAVQQAFDAALASGLAPEAVGAAGKAAGDAYLASMGGGITTGWASLAPAIAQVGERLRAAGDVAMAPAGTASARAFSSAMSEEGRQELDRVRNQFESQSLAAARAAGRALAGGLLDTLPSMHDAWDAFITQSKNMLDPMKEIAWIEAKLSGGKLAAGLESTNPLQRAASEQMRDTLMSQLTNLRTLMGNVGEDGGDSLGSSAVRALRAWQSEWFKTLHGMAQTAATLLKTHSPAKAGPWSEDGGPGEWMLRLGRMMKEKLQAGLSDGGPIKPPNLPDMRGALGRIGTTAAAAFGSGSAGGMTPAYAGAPITVYAYGSQPDDVERQINRAQRRAALRASLQGGIGRADI